MATEKAADIKKAADSKALGQFFELRKQGYDRCLHHGMDCKKEAIRLGASHIRRLDRRQKESRREVLQRFRDGAQSTAGGR
jgi:hypothetical protein